MTTITDPRTPAPDASAWLTNSRVYNLIWLGRWLERAESLARAIDSAAVAAAETGAPTDAPLRAAAESGAPTGAPLRAAAETGDPTDAPRRAAAQSGDPTDAPRQAAAESGAPTNAPLRAVAEAWGVPVGEGDSPLPALLAALRVSIERARDNAHQIAPLAFIQSANALLERVESAGAPDAAPAALRAFAEEVLAGVGEASAVIERVWFTRQGLTDEELMQRFAQ